ncbi:hypothetical protein NDI56_14720 [Haloarcula sp. S1CR25-12]|uniref:DUF2795 domain-containing protein n=1 Tax=Haloarcula saliterrae TaxID=2950534 RepID=A0ABU2FEG5_9EURY|nr:hypothetical protein [Haloarcula sp. S1CR25-12]MDS0260657.1 hypothetical protein [Haloarcula sp. S1CR25-12]
MTGETTDRDEGVDFTPINPVLTGIEYPITTAELVGQHGARSVERTNAESITVQELFRGTGADTFESPEEVRQSLLNLMPGESVGRQRYSDRGGATPDNGPERGDDTL